jgi:hypothetical protein
MDDKVNKKACKVDSSNDVNPDPQQEGEIPYPFNMYGKRVKNGFLLVICLAFTILLMGSVMKPLSNHNAFLQDRFMGWLHCPIVPAALPQSRTARSIPMMSTVTQIDM